MSGATEFLKVKEAACLLGVCPNTIRAWGCRGKIPEYRHPINRFRLYKRSDVEELLHEIERSLPTTPDKSRPENLTNERAK